MNPSQLRKMILAEHVVLRGKMQETQALAAKALQGDLTVDPQLRHHAIDMVDLFLAHIEMEDTLLVPMLRGIDAWGQIRAEHTARDHEWQRAALERLDVAAKREDIAAVARGVDSLVKELLEDMAHEDETVLSPNLLRDDPISIDQSDG